MAYISNKEIKEIIKENNRQIKALQKRNKSYTKDDYITKMKDENNVVEFENLHTYFYTDIYYDFRCGFGCADRFYLI